MNLKTQQPAGLFISFEGIDGAGKSTHLDALADVFKKQGRAVTQTREPGGTALAEKLRNMVLHDEMDSMTEALLVFAARRDHLQQVIEPALAQGQVVLCDRFTDATFAYQGGGRDFDLDTLIYLEHLVQAVQAPKGSFIRQPDLTLWFDLSPELAAQRLVDARLPDKFEAQPVEFFKKVAAGYAQRCEAQPSRFAVIAASQSKEQVWSDVVTALQQRGWLV